MSWRQATWKSNVLHSSQDHLQDTDELFSGFTEEATEHSLSAVKQYFSLINIYLFCQNILKRFIVRSQNLARLTSAMLPTEWQQD